MSRRRRAVRRRHRLGAVVGPVGDTLTTATAQVGSSRDAATTAEAVETAAFAPAPSPPSPDVAVAAATEAEPVAPTVVPERGRRARGRVRRRRRKVEIAAAALLVLVFAAIGYTTVSLLEDDDGDDAAPVADVAPSQDTLLLQVRGADRSALATALLAHEESAGGAGVLVPSRVIAEVPGAGSLPFGQALALPDESISRRALGDLMGIQVDGSWVLDPAAFAALVDRFGGVEVDVDVEVVRRAGGRATVVVPIGPQQRLAGAQAVEFATFLADGEQEVARLPRVQQVLTALLEALPDDVDEVAAAITAAGTGSTSSEDAVDLAALLVHLAADLDADELTFASLPVLPIDAGAGPLSYRADTAEVRALVDTELAASVPEGGLSGRPRVYVLNGVGTPGLGGRVHDRLVEAGFAFAGSRNAGRLDYESSQVIVPDRTAASQQLGERVAAALGLPPETVRVATSGQNVADVIVVVGRDFRS